MQAVVGRIQTHRALVPVWSHPQTTPDSRHIHEHMQSRTQARPCSPDFVGRDQRVGAAGCDSAQQIAQVLKKGQGGGQALPDHVQAGPTHQRVVSQVAPEV